MTLFQGKNNKYNNIRTNIAKGIIFASVSPERVLVLYVAI